jgi:hypothetical protein
VRGGGEFPDRRARKFRLFNLGARIVCCAIAILLAPAVWHIAEWTAR